MASDTSRCFHCGLPIPAGEHHEQKIAGEIRQFCCHGCQTVCAAIYDAGLEGFYRRTPEGVQLGPPPTPPADIEIYDFAEVQDEFTQCSGDYKDIHLLVEGIHCAACVWLIERALAKLPGIVAAEVNLASKRVRVRWNSCEIRLSDIIRALAKIGYAAVPFDPESAEGAMRRANRAMLFRLFFAGFAMMNMMWIAIALYSGANQDKFRDFFHWMGFVLATPTLLYSAYPFFRGAWGGLRARHLSMDLPIAIGLTVTYLYSVYVTVYKPPLGEVYFDTVTNLTFVILIGRYLEGLFRQQAVSATKRLMELQPRVATVLVAGEEKLTPIRGVKVGDKVRVKPGAQVAVDGIVLYGESMVDESMLSGESRPIIKKPGDRVTAGTLNGEGTLTVEVTSTVQDSTLARIIRLVEEAQLTKAPIQRIADRVVPWFVLVTLLLAGFTFWYWYGTGFELALMAATSVLIITCPCALGMATPMSIAVASGLGAKHGILVKNGLVLEVLSRVNHFVFDKTGTLTEGRMQVSGFKLRAGEQEERLWTRLVVVERLSEHAIARAIVEAARNRAIDTGILSAEEFRAVPGQGVQAKVGGERVEIGNAGFLQRAGVALHAELIEEAAAAEARMQTCIHVAIAGEHVAVVMLADCLRPDAATLVAALRAQGIGVTLLTGDRLAVAQAVARQLGDVEVIAEVLPEDKDAVIRNLQAQGKKVAMVGDGVNDAPALVRADVGIALGSGTDVSVESADIVLMKNELGKVRDALALSHRTLRTIRQNIGLSFVYNTIMVPLAMAAKVSPLVAAITMPISSLVVIGNAARIATLFRRK